jgi:hypothetical protein
MTDYGVTSTGFVKKNLEIIKEEINQDFRDGIRSTLDTGAEKFNLLATSVAGQLIGVFADRLREIWDVDQAVYGAMYPDSATGAALDQVASITGARRLAATKSTVTLDRLYIDNGVTIPVGSVVSVGATGARFVTLVAVTNSSGAPATVSTTAESEDTGVIVGYAGTIDTIQTPVSGWSAAAALTSGAAETYTLDGLLLTIKVDRGSEQTVSFTGGDPWSAVDVATEIENDTVGITAVDAGGYVRVSSETEGEGSSIEVTGGTANTILSFSTDEIKGFNSADAATGTEVETDAAFRLRREELLRVTGAATVEAIRARIRDISGVIQCIVIENTDIITDPVTGLPAKSFEAVVYRTSWTAAQEQEVADTIWEVKPAGIETYGSVSKTVTDTMGFDHTIEFSKPTDIPIYIDLTVTTDSDYPLDGDDQVAQALKDAGDLIQVGEDVVALKYKCVPLDVAGVTDVTVFKIDTVTPPVGTGNIVISFRELATFDTSRINVTSV